MVSGAGPGAARLKVTELYSPPRVTKQAHKFGLLPGFALDLTTIDPTDGKPWDFCDPVKRERERGNG